MTHSHPPVSELQSVSTRCIDADTCWEGLCISSGAREIDRSITARDFKDVSAGFFEPQIGSGQPVARNYARDEAQK